MSVRGVEAANEQELTDPPTDDDVSVVVLGGNFVTLNLFSPFLVQFYHWQSYNINMCFVR